MRSTKIIKICSSSLCTCLHHMVILRTRNKITDFFMILAWASPFNKVDFSSMCITFVGIDHILCNVVATHPQNTKVIIYIFSHRTERVNEILLKINGFRHRYCVTARKRWITVRTWINDIKNLLLLWINLCKKTYRAWGYNHPTCTPPPPPTTHPHQL